MRVLVIGATGAVGRPLVPQLISAGHQVSGTTRTPARVDDLRAAGRAEPEVIVYESTAIPASINLRKFDQTFAPASGLRTVGLDHVLAAASAQGVRPGSSRRATPAGPTSAPARPGCR